MKIRCRTRRLRRVANQANSLLPFTTQLLTPIRTHARLGLLPKGPSLPFNPLPPGAKPAPTMTRFHDLDALRAFAMLLGIVLHSAMFMLPDAIWPVHLPYAYRTEPAQNPYGYLVVAIHGFRMPLFFLLSGFFTAMLWQSRGLRQLGEHRLRRVGLPLLVCMLTIIPLTHWTAAGAKFNPLTWPLVWLGGFYHLWFLWFLLLMAAAFILLARLGLQFRHPLWWLLLPLPLLPQYLMSNGSGLGADTPAGFLPDGAIFGFYAAFFLFGVFFYQRGIAVRRRWTAGLAVAALIFLPALVFSFADDMNGLDASARWVRIAAAALQIAFAWLMIFGLMGLFRWTMARQRAWARYLSDASYWLYIAHVPLVIAGQRLAAGVPAVNPHLACALLLIAVTALLLASYRLGVRYTLAGTMLNGRRRRPPAATPHPAAT